MSGNRDLDEAHWTEGGETSWGMEGILKRLSARFSNTPDYHHFKHRERVPVFVYDEVQRGGIYHGILDSSELYGRGRTASNRFTMKVNKFKNPIALVDTGMNYHIAGEIFGVIPELIPVLDQHMHNGEQTKRTLVRTLCRDQTQLQLKDRYFDVFMYVGIEDYWKNKNMTLHTRSTIRTGTTPDLHYFSWDPAYDGVFTEDLPKDGLFGRVRPHGQVQRGGYQNYEGNENWMC